MKSELFDPKFGERQTTDKFTLQSKKLLRVAMTGQSGIVAAAGSMVAYQGQMDFNYKGSGSIGGFIKKKLSGEDSRLMKVRGQGEVFLAREAQDIATLLLEGEAISVNSKSILAFDEGIGYDIKMMRSHGAMMGGGLFNVQLQGNGFVAITTDGPPLLLDCSQQPTFVDPQAVVCWSANLNPTFKNDMNLGSLIGRGSGEAFQMGFHGPGFVVIQPSEGPSAMSGSSQGENGGSVTGMLGDLLG